MIAKNNKICQLLWSIHNCDSTLREKRFQSDYSKDKAVELKKMKNIKNTISYIIKGQSTTDWSNAFHYCMNFAPMLYACTETPHLR